MEDLIYRVLQGSGSELEKARVGAWRRESPRNEQFYHDFRRLLTEAHAAAWDEVQGAPIPSVDRIMALAAAQETPALKPARLRRRLPAGVGWKVGAAAAAAFTIGFALQVPTDDPLDPPHVGSAEVVTGASENTTLELGDGTVIRLAPQSRLMVSDVQGTRDVWLDGRAYFAVAPSEGRPFRVRTQAGEVVVLGTRFDLATSKDDLRLLVVDGSVRLSNQEAGSEGVEVRGSQAARVGRSLSPVVEEIDETELQAELRWIGNFLAFEGTPLPQIARELSRHYGTTVEVVGSRLATETVQAVFIDESLEDVVDAICRAVAAKCSISSSAVTIGP